MYTVVVVEDELAIAHLLCDLLETEGYDAVCVHHPSSLERVLATCSPDLFLIDIMLPGTKSGIEVAQQLRGSGYLSTPMIAMTASRLMSAVAGGARVFDAVIDKPFEIDQMLEVMTDVLAAARSGDQATEARSRLA